MSTNLLRGLPGAATVSLVDRRLRGSYEIDEWGLDPELVALSDPAVSLRWDIEVSGAERIPATGGAVLVFNRRVGISEPWVLARGIRRSSGRFVRTVGVVDLAPVGPFLRRFGAVVDRPDEIAGLLRAGQLVGLPMSRSVRATVGDLQTDRIEAAITTGRPVVPVAMLGREAGRRWRVVVGNPLTPKRRGGPLAAVTLTEAVRDAVQTLLDDATMPGLWL
ncbi:MAG: hypothetical protein KDB02_06715 [Acidimicrobiales bacterium]|nr:hypothetical protein [Acidimicrobiales bacterium]